MARTLLRQPADGRRQAAEDLRWTGKDTPLEIPLAAAVTGTTTTADCN
ncbi:hypothetical protein ACFVH9_17380 [Streptomyces hirsutus]